MTSAETSVFKHGIERVKEGASKHRIALMCAEKEPLECHRTIDSLSWSNRILQ